MQLFVPVRNRAAGSAERVSAVEDFLRRQVARGPRHWAKVVAWVLVAFFAAVVLDVVIGTPRAAEIGALGNMARATTVLDVNNQEVFTLYRERRISVPLAQISPNVIHAVLAIEDQRFYDHKGLDFWRIAGAFVANVRGREKLQGGSTITQQLARKSFLGDDKTFRRKLKEMFLAIRVEDKFTKDEILELYLNKVYFGEGLYGIEAAARGYFAKSAKDLSVEEAALIAGLIQAPSAYAPTDHPDRAIARRAIVLDQMVDAGFLDAPSAAQLKRAGLHLVDGFEHERSGQYFKNYLARLLVDRFGWERVSQGGLRVYATIDAKMQAAAEEAIAEGLTAAEKMRGFKHLKRGDPKISRTSQGPDYLQGSLVAIDPTTGEVRAMVGGRDFADSQFNRAVQAKRQAGSAFKPFVYAAAIESGMSPATLLTDLDTPMTAADGDWRPADGHTTAESMTVRTALRTSSNRAAVQVLREVGIPRAVSFAARVGLDAPSVPSMVLGSGDVTALSMAAAYGVFANGGWLRPPVFIRRVEDANGRVIFSETSRAQHSLSEETSFLMAQMLADVVSAGTGYRARETFRYRAGGKTGTTNDYRDAWFIGFTPALVTSVWVGFDQPKTIVPAGYAGQLAAPIWGHFMGKAVSKDAGWVRQPSGIVTATVCRVSGLLPVEGCYRVQNYKPDGSLEEKSMVGPEYFRRGSEPTEYCTLHETMHLRQGQRSEVKGQR
jgi:1A family penicillin-binding protein